MKKIVVLILLLSITLGSIYAAGSDESGGSESDIVTLKVIGAEPREVMAPVIDAFNAANPDIRAEYEIVAWESYNDVLQTRLGRGDVTPDVLFADTPRIPAFVNRNWLLDVTSEVVPFEDRFIPSTIEASSVDGKVYAYPLNTTSQILYYNKDLLSQAKIEYPSSNPADRLTWEALYELAITAQKSGAEWGLLIDQIDRVYQIQALPESLGGGPGLTGPDMLTPDITNSGWVNSMEFYRKMFDEGVSPRGVAVTNTPQEYAGGNVAFFVGGPWWIKLFQESGIDFGVAPHPYFENGVPATPTDAWSVGINPNSKVIDEAKRFLDFLTISPEGNKIFARELPLPPAQSEVFDWYYGEFNVINGLYDLINYELQNTTIQRPRTIGYIQYETIMQEAFQDIRSGAQVAETLEEASAELESAFARLNR